MANRFCTQCGRPLAPQHRFCANCGTAVESVAVPVASVSTTAASAIPQPVIENPPMPHPPVAPPTVNEPTEIQPPVTQWTGEVPPQYAQTGEMPPFVHVASAQTPPVTPTPPAQSAVVHCRGCGQVLPEGAEVCRMCGMRAGSGAGYCRVCGQPMHPQAVLCVHCGTTVQNGAVSSKKRVVAGLFGILLGLFGVHNFYLGYNGKAIAQLLITLLGWWTVIGPLSVFVWSLVEGILILSGGIEKDAAGAVLSD